MNPEKKSEAAVFGNTLLEFQKESKKTHRTTKPVVKN